MNDYNIIIMTRRGDTARRDDGRQGNVAALSSGVYYHYYHYYTQTQ